MSDTIKIAAIQAEPAWFDASAGVEKTCRLIAEASATGAKVFGFPEAFVPGYPLAIFGDSVDEPYKVKYSDQSLEVGGPGWQAVQAAVAASGCSVVFGFSEKAPEGLYIAQTFFAPDGSVALHRRKVGLSDSEKKIFLSGDAASLHTVVQREGGLMVVGLNSWYWSYAQGAQVTVGSWPPLPESGWPSIATRDTACNVINRHFAAEGGSFVAVSTGIVSSEAAKLLGLSFIGGGFARIFGPTGDLLASAQEDETEQIITADIDLDEIHLAKQMADCVGQYTRSELLSIHVNVAEPLSVL